MECLEKAVIIIQIGEEDVPLKDNYFTNRKNGPRHVHLFGNAIMPLVKNVIDLHQKPSNCMFIILFLLVLKN